MKVKRSNFEVGHASHSSKRQPFGASCASFGYLGMKKANVRLPPIADAASAWNGSGMQSPASTLAAALRGRECRITRREADWNFDFGEGLNIAACVPWRVVTAEGIAHGDEDDGKWFGLSKPVDGAARTNELLRGQKVASRTRRTNGRPASGVRRRRTPRLLQQLLGLRGLASVLGRPRRANNRRSWRRKTCFPLMSAIHPKVT